MIKLTRSQLAELRGCTPSTVSKAKLEKTPDGSYDLTDPHVWQWVTQPVAHEVLENFKKQLRKSGETTDSDEQLKQADIALKKKRKMLLDLTYDEKKKNLVPIELVAAWIAPFAIGLRTYFFPIGKRVCPTDKKTQKKFEKELSNAIEKTLSGAERELHKESKKLIEALDA